MKTDHLYWDESFQDHNNTTTWCLLALHVTGVTGLVSVISLSRSVLLAFLAVLIVVYKELIAGHSQCSNQNNKLLEVHFTVVVFVQVGHDLVNHQGVLAGLKRKHRTMSGYNLREMSVNMKNHTYQQPPAGQWAPPPLCCSQGLLFWSFAFSSWSVSRPCSLTVKTLVTPQKERDWLNPKLFSSPHHQLAWC